MRTLRHTSKPFSPFNPLLPPLHPLHPLQVRLGPLTPYAVHTLRHIREFFGVMFDMKAETSSGTIMLTCIGCGLKNINRKIT